MEVHAPRWSPDGKQVVFMGRNPGKGWRIYLVPSEGEREPQQVAAGDDSQTAPDWSPEGGSLVYAGLPEELTGDSKTTAVHVIDLALARFRRSGIPKGCTALAGLQADVISPLPPL
jgi:Tol biopolymer transport system component